MLTKLILLVCACLISKVTSYAARSGYPNYLVGQEGGAFVSLFDYTFPEVEQACIDSVGPWGYFGIHISPPQKSRDVGQHTWWDRYQPETYDIEDRDGNGEEAFYNMTTTCRDYGVRIYADAVINHMYSGYVYNLPGQAANYTWQIPGDRKKTHLRAPRAYTAYDFHDECVIQGSDYANNSWRVRNCQLAALDDLKTETRTVRKNIIRYLNRLLALGVSGFRIDASKHVNVADTKYWLKKTNGVRNDFFGGGRPYFFMEVIDKDGTEAITDTEYLISTFKTSLKNRKRRMTNQNLVTEFTAGIHLKNEWFSSNFESFATFGRWSNMLPSSRAVAFVTNHDEERYPWMFNYKDAANYELANVFLLTYPYGTVKVHSGYNFNDRDQGRPLQTASVDNCQFNGGNWTCDHLWRAIRNAVGWRNEVNRYGARRISNWWDNSDADGNCIAFSRIRGSRGGFVAINRGGSPCLLDGIDTGLPQNYYCELFSSDTDDCASFEVDSNGQVASWGLLPQEAIIIHTGATTTNTPDTNPYENSTISCVGDFLSELGGTDWDETNTQCIMRYNTITKNYEKIITNLTEGTYQFKVVVDQSWSENYGENGGSNNIAFNNFGYVQFIFDPITKVPSVITNPYEGRVIRCVGDFLSEIGGSDWDQANSVCIMTYNDAKGFYEKEISSLTAGTYQYKVTVDGSWSENYGADGAFNGANIQFTNTDGVRFYWDPFTKIPTVNVSSDTAFVNPYDGRVVRCVGDFLSEIGGADWDAGNSVCIMDYNNKTYMYEKGINNLPFGNYSFKVTIDGTWDENYGVNGNFNGGNIDFTNLGLMTFFFDPATNIPSFETFPLLF